MYRNKVGTGRGYGLRAARLARASSILGSPISYFSQDPTTRRPGPGPGLWIADDPAFRSQPTDDPFETQSRPSTTLVNVDVPGHQEPVRGQLEADRRRPMAHAEIGCHGGREGAGEEAVLQQQRRRFTAKKMVPDDAAVDVGTPELSSRRLRIRLRPPPVEAAATAAAPLLVLDVEASRWRRKGPA